MPRHRSQSFNKNQSKLINQAIMCAGGGTHAGLARACGVNQATVTRWANNECTIDPAYARIIEKLTNGEVTCAALRPDVFGD